MVSRIDLSISSLHVAGVQLLHLVQVVEVDIDVLCKRFLDAPVGKATLTYVPKETLPLLLLLSFPILHRILSALDSGLYGTSIDLQFPRDVMIACEMAWVCLICVAKLFAERHGQSTHMPYRATLRLSL